jgi:hypothetical protein
MEELTVRQMVKDVTDANGEIHSILAALTAKYDGLRVDAVELDSFEYASGKKEIGRVRVRISLQ